MSREEDRKLISEIPREKLPDFIFHHLRDLWAVDGLYYIGIEEAFGTEAATEIDRKVWEVMGKIEARRLKEFLGINDKNIPLMMLSEFGCKPVRWGFLKAFAKEFNPNIIVECKVCPPDDHPNDLWCEWVFTLRE